MLPLHQEKSQFQMKNYARKLISDFLLQEKHQERLDVFATAMLLSPAEEEALFASAEPVAIPTDNGWTAALWLSNPRERHTGQLRIIVDHCRSRKLALITANYYRLHHLINTGTNPNRANTSSSF